MSAATQATLRTPSVRNAKHSKVTYLRSYGILPLCGRPAWHRSVPPVVAVGPGRRRVRPAVGRSLGRNVGSGDAAVHEQRCARHVG